MTPLPIEADMIDDTLEDNIEEKPAVSQKIPIGISSCLIGEKVRFDGGHKQNAYIQRTLGLCFKFRPFCPEMDIGLGTPREPIRLVLNKETDKVHCVGTRNRELDVTDALINSAEQQHHWIAPLCGYVFKKGSPSCGMERVLLYRGETPERDGVGLFANNIMQAFPHLPVEEEGRLGDPVLRENFVKRVFSLHRWYQCAESLSWKTLMHFHAQHKHILMSHNQNRARDLGSQLSQAAQSKLKPPLGLEQFALQYRDEFMSILTIRASVKNHVNVLQHLQGYLKNHLDKSDKQELVDVIEEYRQKRLPLIVPITLMRHHFRRNPDPYIEQSLYLYPHPRELMLLNHI